MHRRTHGRVKGEYDPHNPRHRVPFFVCVRYFSFLVRCEGTGEEKKRGRRTTSGPQRRKAPLVSPLRAPAPLLPFPLPFVVFRSRFSPFFTFQIIQIRVQKGKEKGGKTLTCLPPPTPNPLPSKEREEEGQRQNPPGSHPPFPPPTKNINHTDWPDDADDRSPHRRTRAPCCLLLCLCLCNRPRPLPPAAGQENNHEEAHQRQEEEQRHNARATPARSRRRRRCRAALPPNPSPPPPPPPDEQGGGGVGREGGWQWQWLLSGRRLSTSSWRASRGACLFVWLFVLGVVGQ